MERASGTCTRAPEGSVAFRALACDYDGTLAVNDRIASPSIEALQRARAAGVRLVLVTGRTLFELTRVCERLDLFDAVVAENGGVLTFPPTAPSVMRGRGHPPGSSPNWTAGECRSRWGRARTAPPFGRLTASEYRRATDDFSDDWERFVRVDVTERLVRHARQLAETHHLRGYDALHLASALPLAERVGAAPTFASWDDALDAAAAREGLPLFRDLKPVNGDSGSPPNATR